jgi:NTE family protein
MDVFRLMDFTISKHGLIKGEKVFNAMKDFLPDEIIENLNIPYSAVAADVNSFQEIVFDKGSLHHAIRCSTSIPSVMMPVVTKNQVLVDGGVVNPLPLSRVKRNPGDILIAVDLNHHSCKKNAKQTLSQAYSLDYPIIGRMMKYFGKTNKKQNVDSLAGLLNKTIYIMLHQLSQNSIELYKPDILVKIPTKTCGIFDFHKSKELIEIGRKEIISELNLYEDKIKKASL